jgi:hypothetical protein
MVISRLIRNYIIILFFDINYFIAIRGLIIFFRIYYNIL